jgi:hypothetical protein
MPFGSQVGSGLDSREGSPIRHDNTLSPSAPKPDQAVTVAATSGPAVGIVRAEIWHTTDGSWPDAGSLLSQFLLHPQVTGEKLMASATVSLAARSMSSCLMMARIFDLTLLVQAVVLYVEIKSTLDLDDRRPALLTFHSLRYAP